MREHNTSLLKERRVFALSAITVLLLTGCKSLPPGDVESFSTSVSATRNQTSLALQAVTDLTSQSIIDYAAAQATLTDANFQPVLPPESVATWDAAFAGLQRYSQNLVLLTSPNLTKGYEDAMGNLATALQQTGDDLRGMKPVATEASLAPSLATAFTELSSVLLRLKAQHSAQVIIRESNPTIRQILTVMAEAIGATQKVGLRGTVHAHWEQNKAKLKPAFLSASPDDRRKLAAQYASLLASEVSQDMALASLQRSLLALADAHQALASDRSASLASATAAVEQEVQHTYDLSTRFQKTVHGASAN